MHGLPSSANVYSLGVILVIFDPSSPMPPISAFAVSLCFARTHSNSLAQRLFSVCARDAPDRVRGLFVTFRLLPFRQLDLFSANFLIWNQTQKM
jgi:hypothetical protein